MEIYEKAIGSRLIIPKTVKSKRAECACIFGRDIGQYNTCGHFCRYCYANADNELVQKNMRLHDPASPFLVGDSMAGDELHEAEQKSWSDDQLSLFDFFTS